MCSGEREHDSSRRNEWKGDDGGDACESLTSSKECGNERHNIVVGGQEAYQQGL